MKTINLALAAVIILGNAVLYSKASLPRPNILWLVVEDQSKHYGFNGENS